jgi:predicted cobalt transporter CbtA
VCAFQEKLPAVAKVANLVTIFGVALLLAVTLVAAVHTRLQGILITVVGMTLFTVAMQLLPRAKRDRPAPLVAQPSTA